MKRLLSVTLKVLINPKNGTLVDVVAVGVGLWVCEWMTIKIRNLYNIQTPHSRVAIQLLPWRTSTSYKTPGSRSAQAPILYFLGHRGGGRGLVVGSIPRLTDPWGSSASLKKTTHPLSFSGQSLTPPPSPGGVLQV